MILLISLFSVIIIIIASILGVHFGVKKPVEDVTSEEEPAEDKDIVVPLMEDEAYRVKYYLGALTKPTNVRYNNQYEDETPDAMLVRKCTDTEDPYYTFVRDHMNDEEKVAMVSRRPLGTGMMSDGRPRGLVKTTILWDERSTLLDELAAGLVIRDITTRGQAMEDHLMPFVHYVPTEAGEEWVRMNPAEAERIEANGKAYAAHFADEARENRIRRQVLDAYLENLSFIEGWRGRLTDDARVDYYVGNTDIRFEPHCEDVKNLMPLAFENGIMTVCQFDFYRLVGPVYDRLKEIDAHDGHGDYFNGIFEPWKRLPVHHNRKIKYMMGDVDTIEHCGIISKSSYRGVRATILKIDARRHWDAFRIVHEHDRPFSEKRNECVWRGVQTGDRDGRRERSTLVKRWFGIENVAIVGEHGPEKYKREFMTMKEQLEYKYIISVDGNDVATGLKWQLNSNSVVLMARPKVISWLMEDQLEPYIHYVPLASDYSDLQERVAWCNDHEPEVRQIIKNANEYMATFLDEEHEMELQVRVLDRYFQTQRVIV